jgi:RimJ/RimL family protein N-acetyltransferase
LTEVAIRPIHARVVKDNAASLWVLEHNGFTISGEDRGFAEGRGADVDEWLLVRHN